MQRPTRTVYRQRGAAILLVLIAMAMAVVLSLSFLSSQAPTAVVASNIDKKAKARQIAESALKMAIDYVNEDASWRTDKSSGQWMTAASLNGGTFDLYGTDAADGDLSDDATEAVTLSVVATYARVTHRVSAIVTPGGSGSSSASRLLFVVGNASSPVDQDVERRDLFVGWGYTVTLIDDSDSEANFDAAIAVNDVVYISQTTSASSVAYGFTDATIGVVNEKPYLHDEFGFTTNNTANSATDTGFDIADNSHAITSGFSTGSLTFLSSSTALRYVSSTPATGVTVLADLTGASTSPLLMVADTGATMYGGSAAGRRVMWSFGSDIDFDNLNANGQTLIRRSIDWAAGNTSGPTLIALYEFEEQAVASPTLVGHWKLDEAVSPGFGGVSVGGTGGDGWFWIKNAARVNSYDSRLGTYASQTPTDSASVTVNSTETDYFYVESTGYVGGDAWIGAGGDTSDVIWFSGSATLTGTENVMTSNLVFPTVAAPSGMPASSGDFDKSSGNTVISSDVTYENFRLSGTARVTISGNVTMWVYGGGGKGDDDFTMEGSSEIIIPEGSSLTLYTGEDLDVEGDAVLNGDTTGTDRLTIYAYGSKHVDLKENAVMCGIVYTNDSFHIKDDTRFYGKVFAWEEIKMEDNSQIHQDLALGGFEVGSGSSGSAAVQIKDEITIQNTAFIDGYDATAGAYSSSNRYLDTSVSSNAVDIDHVDLNNADIYGDVYVGSGSDPADVVRLQSGASISGSQSAQASNVTIPNPGTPSGFGSSAGNTSYDNTDVTWSSNQHFDNLTIRNTSVVTVSGNVEVRISGMLNLDNGDIELDPGATLTLHVGDNITVQNTSTINNDTTRPMDVTISQYGDNKDVMIDDATVVGSLHVSDDFTIRNNSHLYAVTLTCDDDLLMNNAEIHIHTASSGGDGLSEDGTHVETAADETTAANDGSVYGTITGGASGVIDNAYALDGIDDYIEIPHDASYLVDGGTVSLHYYPTTTSGIGPLFSKDAIAQGDGGHIYMYRNGSRIAAKIETTSDDPYGTGQTIYIQSSTGVVTRDAWNHVALTWGNGQVRLYADGVLVASANHLGGLGTTSGGTGNAEPIVIGANANNSAAGSATPLASDFFEGRIDDIRIYDLPVDATQAANLAVGSNPGSRSAPGYIALDTSGYGDAADMVVYDTSAISWVGGGGLTFTGDTLATTVGSAAKIHDAIEANGEFAIELIITRMTPGTTDAPSHIFGYSNDPDVHNFLVGQDGTNYEVRARDSATGTDAKLSPEFTSSTDLNTSGDTHLVVSYSGSDVTVFVDGALDETASAGGTLDNWDETLLLVLGGAYDASDYWNGTIKRIAVYDQSFNTSQANNVYNGNEPGSGDESGPGSVDWDEQD